MSLTHPINFIEGCPRSRNHLLATDYIFYEFTPEQAWLIDKALFARWSYDIEVKIYRSMRDDVSLKLSLHEQNAYLDAINELRGMQ